MFKSILDILTGSTSLSKNPKFQLDFIVDRNWETLLVFKSSMDFQSDFVFLQYEIKTGNFIQRLNDKTGQIIKLSGGFLQRPCFRPDGKTFAAHGASMPIVWDLDSGNIIDLEISDKTGGSIFVPRFSPDGNKIAYLISADKRIQVYDFKLNKVYNLPNDLWAEVPFGSPTFIFKSNETIETTTTEFKRNEIQVCEWDVITGKLVSQKTEKYIHNFVLSSRKSVPILSNNMALNVRDEKEGKIRIRDSKTDEILHHIDLRNHLKIEGLIQIESINFIDDDESILIGFANFPYSDPLVINLNSRAVSKKFACPKTSETVKIRIHHKLNRVLTMTRMADIYLWDLKSGNMVNHFTSETLFENLAYSTENFN